LTAGDAHRFTTRLRRPEGTGTATFIEVPLDVPALFGRKRAPLRVTINDHTYRTTVAVYGGKFFLPVKRENREAAGVEAGDEVEVALALDTEPRTVEVPDDLRRALDAVPEAAARFDAMAYTHRREYVEWVTGAKREETRERRVASAVERIGEGLPAR
jgi:hypothetical protein